MDLRKVKKPLPSSTALQQANSSSTLSHWSFIKPLSLINSKIKAKYIFTDLIDDEKTDLIRKYFGKKMTFIANPSHLIRLFHKSKYLLKLKADEISPWNISSPQGNRKLNIDKASLSSKIHQIILAEDISFMRKHAKKLLPANIDQVSIEECSGAKLPLTKNVLRAKRLYLTVLQDQLEDYFKTILRIRGLERIHLSMKKSLMKEEGDTIMDNKIFQPLIKALDNKNLTVINLDFSAQFLSTSLLDILVSKLDETLIAKWHIKIRVTQDSLAGEWYSKVFKKLNYLSLETLDGSNEDERNHVPECDSNCARIPELLSQSKRALSLSYGGGEDCNPLDLKPVLENCSSLETLSVHVRGPSVTWEGDKSTSENVLSWARGLQNIILTSHDEPKETLNEEDPTEIENNTHVSWRSAGVFSKLLEILRSTNCQLKFARANSCCVNAGCKGDVHWIINHIADLKTMKTLEHIDLSVSMICYQPDDIFKRLSNLKKLDLTYCDRDEGMLEWDEHLCFEDMANLTELKVFVGAKEEAPFDTEMHRDNAGGSDNFVKSLPKLVKLEIFELTHFDSAILFSVFWSYLKGFCQLKNLKRVRLDTKGINFSDKEDNEELNAVTGEDIRLKVKEIISMDTLLEEFYVRIIDFDGVDCINYKR